MSRRTMSDNSARWPKRTSLALAALSVFAAGYALAEDAAAPWRLILTEQVKKAKGCDLRELISQNEMKLGDEIVIEGRLACVDGREFTFTRRRPHQKFEFELCEPTVC